MVMAALLAGCDSERAAALEAPVGFVVTFDDTEQPMTRSDGIAVVSWRTDWVLSWGEAAGAATYRARYGTTEGIPEQPRTQSLDVARLSIDAAAGTSVPERVEQDRAAGLLLTSSQLLVSVAAVAGDGAVGPYSAWFSVGDVTADGAPIPVRPADS